MEVRDLGLSLGGKRVLDGLSLRLEEGRIAALVGSPGSGKTALLRVLGGLVSPEAGSAEICGADVTNPAARRETGMLVDEPALWGELSIAGNLEMQSRILGKVDRRRMGKLMKALEILPRNTGSRRAGSCPESLRLRLGAAMALLGQPRLLMLDNIFSGLDSDDAARLTGLLREETEQRGMATLLTGAFFPTLWNVSTDFFRLEAGKIKAHYTKDELLARLPEEPAGADLDALWEGLGKEGEA